MVACSAMVESRARVTSQARPSHSAPLRPVAGMLLCRRPPPRPSFHLPKPPAPARSCRGPWLQMLVTVGGPPHFQEFRARLLQANLWRKRTTVYPALAALPKPGRTGICSQMGSVIDLFHTGGGDVGVDLGGAQVGVAEEFLDAAEVGSVVEEVGGEAVA